MRVGLIIIATGLYDRFVNPLMNSAREHFMKEDNLKFFLFSDVNIYDCDLASDVVLIPIEHEPWPGPTLHRYKHIVANKRVFEGMDYLFYVDVDSLFVAPVGREILGDLVAVRHPGFYRGGGSWCKDPRSQAFTRNCDKYYCGGMAGGSLAHYMHACEVMAKGIEIDEANGVQAIYQDESFWNKYLSFNAAKVLDPSYMMVEEVEKRQLWGINHFQPKIIALAKNHNELRK